MHLVCKDGFKEYFYPHNTKTFISDPMSPQLSINFELQCLLAIQLHVECIA